ncbi:MAG: hypothetical protein DHS20C15_11870 [Planctomycetota bacterium]|nr:MAG: hypothetical protein DHS20C15_11870 [Planctomycetota bacterium]
MNRARQIVACFALLMLWAAPLRAHEGPPFPVLVDEPSAPWSISVWADPDVGLGTFWVQLQPLDGHALPDDTRVSVHVAPADGRVLETHWDSERETWRDGEQFVSEVDFPTREFWLVRVVVESDTADAHVEHVLRVEVTPPGYGAIDLLLYLWPFLALGALWIKAARRHRARVQAENARSTPDTH